MAAPLNIQTPSKTWELSLYELHRSPQVSVLLYYWSICPLEVWQAFITALSFISFCSCRRYNKIKVVSHDWLRQEFDWRILPPITCRVRLTNGSSEASGCPLVSIVHHLWRMWTSRVRQTVSSQAWRNTCVSSGGHHGRDGGGGVPPLSAQRADVSHLSGHAEEHHDDQRVSPPLLLRLHRHRAAFRVRS